MHRIFRTAALGSMLCAGLIAGPVLHAQQDNPPPQADDAGGPPPPHGGMHHGPMSPDQELAHMTKSLGLSTDQQSQIKPILQDRQTQMMQIHQNSSLSRDDKMTQMKALDDSSNQKVEAVLDDQQKAKFERMVAMRKQRMQQMRAMHQQDGAPPPDGGAPPPDASQGGDAQPQ